MKSGEGARYRAFTMDPKWAPRAPASAAGRRHRATKTRRIRRTPKRQTSISIPSYRPAIPFEPSIVTTETRTLRRVALAEPGGSHVRNGAVARRNERDAAGVLGADVRHSALHVFADLACVVRTDGSTQRCCGRARHRGQR